MIDHGIFEGYRPDADHPILQEVPNALFARQVATGLDWYEFQRSLSAQSIKALVTLAGAVISADRDASRLSVPAGLRVIEFDHEGDDADALRRMLYADGIIAAPAIDLVAYAKDASWRKEIGGIVIGGIPVATDDRSQLKILGSRVAADADPNWSTNWDAANGQTFPIDAPTMIMISNAVEAHVNSCFSIRASVKAAIAAGTITTTAEIDAAFA